MTHVTRRTRTTRRPPPKSKINEHTKNLFVTQRWCWCSPKKFGPTIFFEPKLFSDPKFIQTQNNFWTIFLPKFLADQKLFLDQTLFLYKKKCLYKKIFYQKILLTQHIFQTQHIFSRACISCEDISAITGVRKFNVNFRSRVYKLKISYFIF